MLAKIHPATINMIMLSFESKQAVITNHQPQATNHAVTCANEHCTQTYQINKNTYNILPKKKHIGPGNSDILHWDVRYQDWHTDKLEKCLDGDARKNYFAFMDNMYVHWLQCHPVEPMPFVLENYYRVHGITRKRPFQTVHLQNGRRQKT